MTWNEDPFASLTGRTHLTADAGSQAFHVSHPILKKTNTYGGFLKWGNTPIEVALFHRFVSWKILREIDHWGTPVTLETSTQKPPRRFELPRFPGSPVTTKMLKASKKFLGVAYGDWEDFIRVSSGKCLQFAIENGHRNT